MSYSQVGSAFFFPLQLHFSTIIIAIFVIFLSFPTSIGIKDCYKECSSLKPCGNISNIGYPFWGYQFRPIHCGHPSFELVCPQNDSDDLPTLHIHRYDDPLYSSIYQVLGINNSSMTIMLQDFYGDPGQCLIPFSNLTAAAEELIEYSTRVEKIGLSYGCDPNWEGALAKLKSFTCPRDEDNSEQASHYYWENDETKVHLKGLCKESIEVPIIGKDNLTRGNITLDGVLKKGFEVNYTKMYLRDCLPCEKSGGHCGYLENSAFICFGKSWDFDSDCRKSGFNKLRVILIGSVSSAMGICMLIILVILIIRRSTKKLAILWKGRTTENQNVEAFLRIYGSLAPKRYTYSSIKKITNSFTDKLGEGGYATVYKGKLSEGRPVAVKLFKQLQGNGEDFINEVASIGRTNHVNIVSLLGFCFEGKRRALIYEFMSNGSLDKFTFLNGSNCPLPWEMIFNIAQGIAKGLDYLHRGCNERILHFDIKPHNVLLDEQFRPKISDFGLARICPLQESSISMLEARGTIGYIAPEVFCRRFGSVSHKSDVYSYGMMVLDLVCGRTNTSANVQCSSELYFPHWIYKQVEREGEMRLDEIVDDEEKCVQRKMILVSLWCIQTYPSSRPSMSHVVDLLKGSLELIPMPPMPCLSSPPRLLSIQSSEALSPQ